MKKSKYPIPDWVTCGKSVRQFIKELRTFEDQDREVRISLDDGKHYPISLVGNHRERANDMRCCSLRNPPIAVMAVVLGPAHEGKEAAGQIRAEENQAGMMSPEAFSPTPLAARFAVPLLR